MTATKTELKNNYRSFINNNNEKITFEDYALIILIAQRKNIAELTTGGEMAELYKGNALIKAINERIKLCEICTKIIK